MTKSVGLCSSLSEPTARDGEDALDAELLDGVDVGAKVELRGKNAMAAAVPRQKGDFAPLELAEYEGVGGVAEGRFDRALLNIGESGHGVEPAAADDADFRCLQTALRRASGEKADLPVIYVLIEYKWESAC